MYVVFKQLNLRCQGSCRATCLFLIVYFCHFVKTIEGQVICSKGLCELFSQNSSHFQLISEIFATFLYRCHNFLIFFQKTLPRLNNSSESTIVFSSDFLHRGYKIKGVATSTKGFFWKKIDPSRHIYPKFSTSIFYLSLNLAKSSCGRSPKKNSILRKKPLLLIGLQHIVRIQILATFDADVEHHFILGNCF